MDFLWAFRIRLLIIFKNNNSSDAFVFFVLTVLFDYVLIVFFWPDLVKLVLHI